MTSENRLLMPESGGAVSSPVIMQRFGMLIAVKPNRPGIAENGNACRRASLMVCSSCSDSGFLCVIVVTFAMTAIVNTFSRLVFQLNEKRKSVQSNYNLTI